jgi:hypothetical protein
MKTLASRRAALGILAVGLAACETQPPRLPANTALRPPLPSASEPAPMPSDAANAFGDRRGRAMQAAPSGPAAMPGFGPQPQVGSDIELAPIPANAFR